MASNAVKKVQDKLFRGGSGDGASSGENAPPLTINIPKSANPQPLPNVPTKQTDTTPGADETIDGNARP